MDVESHCKDDIVCLGAMPPLLQKNGGQMLPPPHMVPPPMQHVGNGHHTCMMTGK